MLDQFIDEETLGIDENNAQEVPERGNNPIRWPTQDTNPINEYTPYMHASQRILIQSCTALFDSIAIVLLGHSN